MSKWRAVRSYIAAQVIALQTSSPSYTLHNYKYEWVWDAQAHVCRPGIRTHYVSYERIISDCVSEIKLLRSETVVLSIYKATVFYQMPIYWPIDARDNQTNERTKKTENEWKKE